MNESGNVVEVAIVGGGQAGLAVAYELQQRGIEYVVLEASLPGESWRRRYDSLVLFTPSQYSALPGCRFPLADDRYPTKDQAADYIRRYAQVNHLNVKMHQRVVSLRGQGGRFVLSLEGGACWHARQVVVATGALQQPYIPDLAKALDPGVFQIHSDEYKNPDQLPSTDGLVVVVGAGNSGAQIAEELAVVRPTVISYEVLPKRFPQRWLGKDIFWWFQKVGVMDRQRSENNTSRDVVGSIPLINSTLLKLISKGRIQRRGRAVRAHERSLYFAQGDAVAPAAVIWATGFRNQFDWIEIPGVLSDAGHPRHVRGVSDVPGLYFVGLPGLHTKGSAFIGFVGRDASYLAEQIERGESE